MEDTGIRHRKDDKKRHEKKSISEKLAIIGYAVFTLAFLYVIYLYWDSIREFYSDAEAINQLVEGYGTFGPIIFIFLQAMQVLVFIIPGQIFTIGGGYAFGIIWGTIYSVVGTMIGSIVVFMLAKKYGRPFVEKLVSKKDLSHIDIFFRKRGKTAIFLTRLIPVLFPNDAVSIAAGLTPIKTKDYVLYSVLGFFPHLLLLSYFGNEILSGKLIYAVGIAIILIAAFLCYTYRHKIKVFFIKEIREFEKEIEMIERKSVEEIVSIEKDFEKL